jgi:hypothetical protein
MLGFTMMALKDKIYSFYWIDKGGITRFKWYISPEEAAARGDRDDLLAGFISAIMSFSREMFRGEDIANMDLLNHRIFFAGFRSGDILALVTDMNFDSLLAKRILSGLIAQVSKIQIPDHDGRIDSDNWMKQYLLNSIESIIPKSLHQAAQTCLNTHWENPTLIAYLLYNSISKKTEKKFKENIDFEAQTFLESVFWENVVQAHQDLVYLADKIFKLGDSKCLILQTQIGILVNVYHQNEILSEVFDNSTTLTRIKEISDELEKCASFGQLEAK